MMTWYDPDACFPLAGNLAAQQQQLLTVTMPYPADLAVTGASPNMVSFLDITDRQREILKEVMSS